MSSQKIAAGRPEAMGPDQFRRQFLSGMGFVAGVPAPVAYLAGAVDAEADLQIAFRGSGTPEGGTVDSQLETVVFPHGCSVAGTCDVIGYIRQKHQPVGIEQQGGFRRKILDLRRGAGCIFRGERQFQGRRAFRNLPDGIELLP